MDNSQITAEIKNIKDILDLKLKIPIYQRPYKWSTKSVNTLLDDIWKAFKDNNEEYRIGTIILHKENEKEFNIVDGQQRLTTIAILLSILETEENIELLNEKYSPLSYNCIRDNYQYLLKRINMLSKEDIEKIKKYILEKCTVVKIITHSSQEAFQFFDSQNSRGKELAPHDLLKSFNLREMNNESEVEKKDIISKWEMIDQKELKDLFANYLYPIKRWHRSKKGIYYSMKHIDEFKGIKLNNNNNYAVYSRLSHVCAEKINKTGENEIFGLECINPYQLNQPIIVGKRFFGYIFNYNKLLSNVRIKIDKNIDKNLIPQNGAGNMYTKELFECSLMFFADRFGLEKITEETLKQLYTWAYSLRSTMIAVYKESINNYAIGKRDGINKDLNMFELINEMKEPEDLNLINFEEIKKDKLNTNYETIYKKICEWNNWKEINDEQ